jgi:RNA polymerase sigma factor (TIGR02999 family)
LLQDPPIGHHAPDCGLALRRPQQSQIVTSPAPLRYARIGVVNVSTDTLPGELQRIAEELMPLYYADVKRMARSERRKAGAGDTLQTTALIHEAYLKLFRSPAFNDRAHFLRASALAMRHVLINHARENIAEKRGGGMVVESLTASNDVGASDDQSLLDIHEALERLAQLDVRLAQVVECRFFAGLDEADTALALGISDRTVRRDWIKARAWLRRELDETMSSSDGDA